MSPLLRVMTEPQEGATYDDLLRVAKATEELGFDAFFRSDHLAAIGDDPGPGSTDAWATLAGLARDTSRIRLGTMVSSVTFRLPAMLALAAATVDQMSGGRVELGLGSGWFAREHEAFGIPFPEVGERFDELTEQLEVVTGIWSTPAGSTYSFSGRRHTLVDHPALPRPVQDPPPVVVGGKGRKRTPMLAARFAAEYNVPFVGLDETATCFDRARAACAAAGRDPSTLVLSAAQTLGVGRDEAEARRRAEAAGWDLDDLRSGGLGGTVAEAVDRLGRLSELGAARVYLQVMDLHDMDHLELVASEVVPQL